MRVTIVYVAKGRPEALAAVSKAMAGAIESAGHQVQVFDGRREAPRLGSSDYVILGTESLGLTGKINPRIGEVLSQAGGLPGKRSMAFLLKRGFSRVRAIRRLMRAMEAEGMIVTYDEIIGSPAEAVQAGRAAPVQKG